MVRVLANETVAFASSLGTATHPAAIERLLAEIAHFRAHVSLQLHAGTSAFRGHVPCLWLSVGRRCDKPLLASPTPAIPSANGHRMFTVYNHEGVLANI